MKKFGILAAVIVGLLAVPGGAIATESNGSDCSHASANSANDVVVANGPAAVYVHRTADSSGSSGSADTAVGGCVNAAAGGTVEVANGSGSGGNGTSAVIDGDNDNAVGQAQGYVGLSNYEDGGSRDANCTANGPDQGAPGSTNSGGCFGVDGGPWVDLTAVPAPTPICGNTSGNTWNSTPRDGCSNP